jgi:hypothetical protein
MTVQANPVGFGGGLGAVVGAQIGANDLSKGQDAVNSNTAGVIGSTQPYNTFGQSFLPATTDAIDNIQGKAGNVESYDQFTSGYQNTPAAQYQLQQANEVQNNSAAARGDLLSGANERALGTIDHGIVSQGANTAYNEYLQGNQQGFGQLESALGNMFSAIGVGQAATGQQVSATNSQNQATSSIAEAQAKDAQSKGSGLGSMFNGLGSFAAAF